MKYKNENGIELSYEGCGSDIHAELVKEVIKEAIKIGNAEIYTKYPRQGWVKVKEFLNENFSLDSKVLTPFRSDD
tara:strand:+ start:100 stop:324 length:225 start_codon:yes stop_codon:yes gene_type:complete